MNRRMGRPRARLPRGMVMIVVLVVVAMISLGSYALVESMYVEHKAARLHGERLQLEHALASGAERLAALLEPRPTSRDSATPATPSEFAERFAALPLLPTEGDQGGWEFQRIELSLDDPRPRDEAPPNPSLQNESSRLNLAVVLQWELAVPGAGRNALLQLPGMTEAAAEAILDWLDADSAARPQGAENDFYQSLPTTYAARNGLPTDLRELLLVRHVTPRLLLGERDPRESTDDRVRREISAATAAASQPWSEYLTLHSAERRTRPDGRPRIDLNQPDLAALERQLSEAIEPRLAQFIIVWRQFGPSPGSEGGDDAAALSVDVSQPARYPIVSPLDLVGAKVAVPSDHDKPKVYASPLGADHAQGAEALLTLLDHVTTQPEPTERGRINVNLAPAEVLRGVPGLNAGHVQAILSARGDATAAIRPERRHAVWLWTEGLIDLETMKRLMPTLTGGGDVYRARLVARGEPGERVAAADVLLDASQLPARVAWLRVDWNAPTSALDSAAPRESPSSPGGPFPRGTAPRATAAPRPASARSVPPPRERP